MNYTNEGKNTISRDNEINLIGYQIPNSDDIIVCRPKLNEYIVKTMYGFETYTARELSEKYVLDLNASDLERLNWSA